MKREKVRVLIAESDSVQRKLMEEWLNHARGITLCPSVADGFNGWAFVCRERPDVVVWDAFLPHMDALSLLEALSDLPRPARPEVIVTLRRRTPQLVNTLLASGAGYLMDWPLKFSTLERRILAMAAPADETPVEACLRLYELPPDAGRPYEVCRCCMDYYLSVAPDLSLQLKQMEVDVSRQIRSTPTAVQKSLHRAIVHIHQTGAPAFRRIWTEARAPTNKEFLLRVTTELIERFPPDAREG